MKLDEANRIYGWISLPELEWLAKQASKHQVIVEVGSFVGRSTRALGDNAKGVVYAIDDFEGPRDVEWSDKPGFINIISSFIVNLKDLIKSGAVIMVVSDHATATIPVVPDMVFIDGSHEYNDVKRDIETWNKRLAPGGLLCGDDADFEDVKKALSETINYKVIPGTKFWVKE